MATKSKKNKVTVDCDYIDNMRLNFNNEEMINFLPFWLESQKAEDGRSALSDGTDYSEYCSSAQSAYNIVKKRTSCHLLF